MNQTVQFPSRPVPADYAAAEFRGNAISLFELFKANLIATQKPLISGKTFIDCTIEGPAVLLPMQGCNFDACNLGMSDGDARNLLLMPLAKNRVTGAIAVADCLFQRCQFFAVGYTGPDTFIDRMIQVLDQKPADPAPDA